MVISSNHPVLKTKQSSIDACETVISVKSIISTKGFCGSLSPLSKTSRGPTHFGVNFVFPPFAFLFTMTKSPLFICRGCSLAALVPFISMRIVLAIVFLMFGTAVSTSDVGCNTLIVWELKDRVGPRLALMHTMFGVGAILSPLIVRASDEIRGDAAIAYWVASAAIATVATVVLLHRAPLDPHLEKRETEVDISKKQIALIVLFFLAYVALEVVFVTWIYTYGKKTGLSKNESAILTSTYWIGFMLGRFATVFLARKSHGILFIQLGALLNIAACLVLYLQIDSLLLPCAIIYGIAAAPQFPLMFGFIGNRTSLSGKMTARIVGTAGVSSTTLPWLAGQFLERVGSWTFPTFLACTAATVFIATKLITNSFGVPKHISVTN